MTISPYPIYPFPGRPISDVTPFTYRDGRTFLELIEDFREWAGDTLTQELSETVRQMIDAYGAALTEIINQGNANAVDLTILFDSLKAIIETDMSTWPLYKASIEALVDQINNKSGGVDVQHVALSGDATVNIDPTWPKNVPVTFRFTQDETGGWRALPGAHVVGDIPVNPAPGSVTDVVLVPDGGGAFTVDRLGFVSKWRSTVKIGNGALLKLPESYNSSTVVAIGQGAMRNATEIKTGIAIGNRAMEQGTMSRDNIAIGDDALWSVQGETPDYSQAQRGGTRNIAIGGNAGRFIVNGNMHVTIGRNAGSSLVGGVGATAVGSGALAPEQPIGLSGVIENWAPTGGDIGTSVDITAVGYSALGRCATPDNTAFGSYALARSTSAGSNVAMGTNALRRLDDDTWINGRPLRVVNIAGTYLHNGNQLTMNINGHGVKVGDTVLIRLTSGASQTLQNDQAPATVTLASDPNSFVVAHPVSRQASGTAELRGVVSGEAYTPSKFNTALGAGALPFLVRGTNNTVVGATGAYSMTGGSANTGVGYGVFRNSLVVNNNTGVGHGALSECQSNDNTAVGLSALGGLNTGTQNTAIGYMAGRYQSVGSNVPQTEFNNTTSLGFNTRPSGSDQVQLGNAATTTYVFGTVQNRSDFRDKADIRDTVLGLDFINELRPVDYRWDMREDYEDGEPDGTHKRTRFHHGLIAQEVAALEHEFGGYQDHMVNGGCDVQSLGYDEFVAPLIKAVQELSATVTELRAEIETLKGGQSV